MIRKYVLGAALCVVTLLALTPLATAIADTAPTSRPDVLVLERSAEAFDTFLSTVLGGATAALVFVGTIFVTFRPLIMAKVAEAIASVQFDKRKVFETAVAAGLELHPNDYDKVAEYVRSTIPDTLRDLGVNISKLPSIVQARKFSIDRERLDKAKRPA